MGGHQPDRAVVLLVDRDEGRRSDIALDLASAGFAVLVAADVGEAADRLAATDEPVAALVSDVDPGARLAAELRRRNGRVIAVHTRGFLSPPPALQMFFLDRATTATAIARVVRRLYSRPNSELSNT